MRRFQALLIAAGLATTLSSAAAGPSTTEQGERAAPPAATIETHEWSMSKGRLGVLVMSLTPELRRHFGVPADRGVMVAEVEPGTPAAAAGLAAGDIITAVGATAIDDAGDVIAALDRVKAGGKVSLAIVRDQQARTVDATLTEASAGASASARARPGAAIEPSLEHWPRWLRDALKPLLERGDRDATGPAFAAPRWSFGPPSPCGGDDDET